MILAVIVVPFRVVASRDLSGCSCLPDTIYRLQVANNAEIESGNNHIVPATTDPTECHVHRRGDSIATWIVAVEGNGTEKLQALGVTGSEPEDGTLPILISPLVAQMRGIFVLVVARMPARRFSSAHSCVAESSELVASEVLRRHRHVCQQKGQ